MLYRMLPVVLAALALALLVTAPAIAADDKTHEGKIYSVSKGKFTMTDSEGSNKTTHKVSSDAKITCDGKECKLSDLKEGYFVKVWYSDDNDKTANKIEARTKEKK